jgi:hypothetical protein
MLKKRLVSLAASAVALMASCAAVPTPAQGRHFLLGAGDGGTTVPGLTRFFSQVVELAEGTTQSWVTITRTGNFTDPRYGNFQITPTHLDQMVTNFNARVLGQDVFLDVAHRPNDGAAGKFVRLSVENGRLRGLVEWTAFGVAAVKERGFTYLSAEYHEAWTDNEKQQPHGCVLLGAGLTTRPVIKHLEPVLLSFADGLVGTAEGGVRVGVSHQLLKELTENATMNIFEQLKAKLLAQGHSAEVVEALVAEAKSLGQAAVADEAKCLALLNTYVEKGQKLADGIKALGFMYAHANPGAAPLAAPAAPVNVAAEVARQLAERDAATAQNATTLAANMKLLSDTIAAGDTTLPADSVKALAADFEVMVRATSTPAEVKELAHIALQYNQRETAAARLSGMGYVPVGNARIEVGAPQTVVALQTEMDRRLGLDRLPDAQRYFGTGGQLLAANRQFAERALAQFDAEHGAQLHAEHRMLSGGQGSVSDVAVPVAAERTVLREALYNLQSLAFVNVGTAPFANVITVPYSYRDTAAAGAAALRRYEGQGIRRAGVIQTQEEARPIPQKLAFSLSAEMRLLMSASPIDFDPVAENVRNIIRIVGEDTEALNMNELVCSADEYGAATQTDTLTASVNGTNSVFVTSKFPVVRPRKVYDLKGTQVGSTTNPITVTLNAVARTEFVVNADGSALAAGTYWVMDYNLGELRFVTEAGAPVVPTNAWALTVAYSYTTNAVKWDTDAVNGEDVKDRYDRLLTTVGGRKAVISADRYYTPNMLLMSATVDNAVSQARSFEANASRVATGLAPDGSVGQVKGIATFNTSAPGLLMGDSRILVGERGNCRFRMVKPFAMNPLEQQRDSNGRFTDGQEGFGTQWVVSHTPTQLKNSLTSVVLYSATGRVARA